MLANAYTPFRLLIKNVSNGLYPGVIASPKPPYAKSKVGLFPFRVIFYLKFLNLKYHN
jgi:hypothetical protein